ncbi:hypothetical protein M514_20518 [Trichuris suis]|uniref:CCHC-type domain-containing protein n=1 Tax=Trichuris suis TaxID=68888 RepID=A0A085NCS3_9BILA|nr:hypothetical protein M514_20518 [Trichuris suis]
MSAVNVSTAASAVIAKLNGLNYASWSFQMRLVLMESDLWTTIQPGEDRPEEESPEKLRLYDSRQGRALAKICLAIGDEQQQHVQHLSSPKEVWEELQKLYAPKDSKFRVIQLRRQLYSEKLESHTSMDSYLATMNHLVTELISTGDKISDDIAMTILCGLSDDWDNVVSVICNLPASEFSCATVKQRLLVESQRRRDDPSKGTKVLAARATAVTRPVAKNFGRADVTCYKCSRRGHYARECKSKQGHRKQERSGRCTGWQAYSTFSFLRYRTLGYNEWEWNIFTSLAVGANVNVQPPVGGSTGPQMSARFGSFWSALSMDAAGGAARTNVTATPYDDETGAMMWLASRLQRQPAHWFDEDAFLRLPLIGMVCLKSDWINEDRLTYVIDPELVDGVVEYNRAMPQHAFDVQAVAVPIDMYIALLTGKEQGSGLFDVDYWDKNTAVIPVRMIFEGTWLIPYVFCHLTSEIWNGQTHTVSVRKKHVCLDALPNASLCHVPGPTRVLFVLVDCTSRNVRASSWRLGTTELGIDVPIWYRSGAELRSTPIEGLFWQWLCGQPENVSIINGSASIDVGQA